MLSRSNSFKSLLDREEYIDWRGYFHTEYAHLRRFAKGDYFATTIRVKAEVKGIYTLHVEVKVHEAPNYNGELTVESLKSPNEWANEHWTDEWLDLNLESES